MQKNELHNRIIYHICKFSFGPSVSQNQDIINALIHALPMFEDLLDENPYQNIKAAYDVAKKLSPAITEMKRSDERRRCFEAALVMLLASRPEGRNIQFPDQQSFLEAYPLFRAVNDKSEIEALMNFCNMIKVVMLLMNCHNKKAHILDLVTRITEGSGVKYVTGSGEREETKNRVLIFETEGRVVRSTRSVRVNGTLIKRRVSTKERPILENGLFWMPEGLMQRGGGGGDQENEDGDYESGSDDEQQQQQFQYHENENFKSDSGYFDGSQMNDLNYDNRLHFPTEHHSSIANDSNPARDYEVSVHPRRYRNEIKSDDEPTSSYSEFSNYADETFEQLLKQRKYESSTSSSTAAVNNAATATTTTAMMDIRPSFVSLNEQQQQQPLLSIKVKRPPGRPKKNAIRNNSNNLLLSTSSTSLPLSSSTTVATNNTSSMPVHTDSFSTTIDQTCISSYTSVHLKTNANGVSYYEATRTVICTAPSMSGSLSALDYDRNANFKNRVQQQPQHQQQQQNQQQLESHGQLLLPANQHPTSLLPNQPPPPSLPSISTITYPYTDIKLPSLASVSTSSSSNNGDNNNSNVGTATHNTLYKKTNHIGQPPQPIDSVTTTNQLQTSATDNNNNTLLLNSIDTNADYIFPM